MRALVTGAGGFVGSAVVRALVSRGHGVVAAVRPGAVITRLDDVRTEIELRRADLADPAGVARLASATRPEVCAHLVAAGTGADDLPRVLALDAFLPPLLARSLAAAGCRRLVTAGCSTEYGRLEGLLEEHAAGFPDDVRAAAKLAGGVLARAAGAAAGLETVHLRAFAVYGPGDDLHRQVPAIAAALLDGRQIDLPTGRAGRDFVYVEDVAAAFVTALETDGAAGETVNVGSGRPTTVCSIALQLAAIAGADPHLLRFGALPRDEDERISWWAATEKARRLLGWVATTPLEQGLRRTLEEALGSAGLRRAA